VRTGRGSYRVLQGEPIKITAEYLENQRRSLCEKLPDKKRGS